MYTSLFVVVVVMALVVVVVVNMGVFGDYNSTVQPACPSTCVWGVVSGECRCVQTRACACTAVLGPGMGAAGDCAGMHAAIRKQGSTTRLLRTSI